MKNFAATSAGFRSGLLKVAATPGYDNQPGPHPGNPAAPDSHRKRNVALGAALIGGGMLGTKKLYSMGGQMAQANRSSMAKGIGAAARRSIGKPEQMAAVRRTASKFQQLNKSPITIGERGRALKGGFDKRVGELKTKFVNKRNAATSAGIRRDIDANDAARTAKNLEGYEPPAAVVSRGQKAKDGARRVGRFARNAAIGGAVLAGGSIAGASAASRAREQEDSRTPGA